MFAEINKKYTSLPALLPFVVCTVGETRRQSPITREAGYPLHHLIIVTGGDGVFRTDSGEFPVREGDGVFSRAGVPHAYRSSGDVFSTMWLTFVGGESVLDHYGVQDTLRFEAPPHLCASLRALEKFCGGNSTVLTRSSAGYAWLIDWLEGCFAPLTPIPAQVRRFLEANFSLPITLDDVADAVHMSRYALCHYYKQHCGHTVMEELRSIRIAKAKELLRLESESVAAAARRCGFDSPGYFGKIFRLETGCTPKEWARRNR